MQLINDTIRQAAEKSFRELINENAEKAHSDERILVEGTMKEYRISWDEAVDAGVERSMRWLEHDGADEYIGVEANRLLEKLYGDSAFEELRDRINEDLLLVFKKLANREFGQEFEIPEPVKQEVA